MEKVWYAITCPICGWRHSLKKFTEAIEPIAYPAQLVTGGGRASGFRVVHYIPWVSLPELRVNVEVWRALNCEYMRLASAYDAFYDTLGFLSPRLAERIDGLNKEVFRLRAVCRDLQDRLDRLLLLHPGIRHPSGADTIGVRRILEETSRRDREDRSSGLDLLRDRTRDGGRPSSPVPRRDGDFQDLHTAKLR